MQKKGSTRNGFALLTITNMNVSGSRATQQIIAERAKCSIMTVSRALRGHPNVSSPLRARILALAEALDYRPDPILSSLNSYRTQSKRAENSAVIAYLINWQSEHSWRSIEHLKNLYDGTEARARELGFRLEPFYLGAKHLHGKKGSDVLRSRGIKDLIVSPLHANVGHLRLDWKHFTTVSIGYSMLSPLPHFVTSDYFQGALLALRKLQQMGYKRIGLAIGRRHDLRTMFRWNSACLGFHVNLPSSRRVRSLVDSPHDGPKTSGALASLEKRSFQRWFLKEKPDAVLSLGLGIPDWIRELDFLVPEDVGYANLDLHDDTGKFAGIYQHPKVIGAAAVDLLHILRQRFEKGVPEVPQSIVVNPSWIDGATSTRRTSR